jgi:PAS domain S-box-containing protein
VRLILLISLFCWAMTAGVLGLRTNGKRYLEVLYHDRQQQLEQSTQGLLNLNRELLEQIAVHYSNSSEIFRFAISGQSTEAVNNLETEVDNRNISVLWLFDRQDQRLLFSVDPDLLLRDEDTAISPDLLIAIRQAETGLHFYRQAANGDVYELYGTVIQPGLESNTEQPGSGVLLVGKRLDEPYLLHLAKLLGAQLVIVPQQQVSQPKSWLGEVILQYPLPDWQGSPLPVVLQARIDQPMVTAVIDIWDNDTYFFLALAILFLAGFGLALYLWIYYPLEQISAGLETNRPEPLARLLKDRTEFGNVARLIQRSFQFQAEMDAEIAHRREVESALRVSEATYRALVDFSIQGFAIFQQGQIVFTNLALAEVLGYSQTEMANLPSGPVTGLFHPEDELQVWEYLETCPGNRLPDQRQKVRMLRQDGSQVWMEVLASPVQYNGAPAVQMAFLDVTKRELAEQAYRGEQEFVLAILNTVNSIVVVLDREGRVVRSNPACALATGYSMDEVHGQPLWTLFKTLDGTSFGQDEVLKLIAEQSVVTRENLFFVRNGLPRSIAWSNGFIFDEAGQVKYMVGTGMDVTERRQREQQQAVIAALASDLRGMLPRAAILEVITNRTAQFLQCDTAAVEMYRTETSELVVEKVSGELARGLEGIVTPPGQGVSARVLQTREPYLNNALEAEPDMLWPELRQAICAGAWVPLVAEGKPLGLIFAGSRREIQPADFSC